MSGEQTIGIAIFVKTPGLSPVKTRLAAEIGQSAAERLHGLSAAAVASVARQLLHEGGARVYWAVAEALPQARPCWPDLPLLAQGEGGLGERMDCIHRQLLQQHDAALLLGADVPQLRLPMLRQVRDALLQELPSCLLGPAFDGGFWAFGSNRAVPRAVWLAPDYGGSDVAACFTEALLRSALAEAPCFSLLPLLRDLDRAADLPGVQAALAGLPEPTPAQRELQEALAALLQAGSS